MDGSIHISQAVRMLNSGDPVSLKVWKKDGSIIDLKDCVSLRYDFYGGWRNIKVGSSKEIRKIRDCLIFSINDLEVYL